MEHDQHKLPAIHLYHWTGKPINYMAQYNVRSITTAYTLNVLYMLYNNTVI